MTVAFSIRFMVLLGSTTLCIAAACSGNVIDPRSHDAGATDALCANPTTAADCASCASMHACEGCVRTVDPAGSKVSDALTIKDCGCAAGSMCNSACKDDPTCPSGMMQATPGCFGCLEGVGNGDPCVSPYFADCEANSDCDQYLIDFQPCALLP